MLEKMSPFNPMQLLLYLGIAFLKLYSVLSSAKMQSKKYVNFQTITVSKKYCELEYRNKLDINPRESCKKARLVSQFQFYFKINVVAEWSKALSQIHVERMLQVPGSNPHLGLRYGLLRSRNTQLLFKKQGVM